MCCESVESLRSAVSCLLLTTSETERFMKLVSVSLLVKNEHDFQILMKDHVQYLIPHTMYMVGIVRVMPMSKMQVIKQVLYDYPLSYISAIQASCGNLKCPIFKRWICTREPQFFSPTNNIDSDIDPNWLTLYKSHSLGNQLVHGMRNMHDDVTSYFSFCNSPEMLKEKLVGLCKIIIPFLHASLLQIDIKKLSISAVHLTSQEQVLLNHLKEGKSNASLAKDLYRSEKTIKNQLTNLYKKLQVTSRSQAICKTK
jgi:DNA-binding CsgD family transcriptional regulator